MGQAIGKRDKRNPGHCWQDNELYDVFQPVIGYLAAHIFAVMSRWCYGSEVRLGLRELAEEADVSRSAAQRATRAMESLGMVRISAGRGRAAASYELLDLKEAAQALGATWDIRRSSYQLSPAQVRALKARVARSLACVPVRDAKIEEAEAACVPVRDATAVEKGSPRGGNPPVVSQLVSQKEGVCVPERGEPSITQRHKDIKTKPTPTPPAKREGGCVESLLSQVEQEAADRVCRECGVTDPRLERSVARALQKRCEATRGDPGEVADAMIAARREYERDAWLMRWPTRADKFFKTGMWLNADTWPYDHARLELERAKRVGVQ